MTSPIPFDEVARLKALNRYGLLTREADPLLEDVVAMAAMVCQTPIAQIGFLGRDRLWIKAGVGLPLRRVPRRASFSAYAICKQGEILVVQDTYEDWRFSENPLLAHTPAVRFFAAVPLIEPSGFAIGTLIVMGYQPRGLSDKERRVLCALAQTAMALIEARQMVRRLEGEISERIAYERRSNVRQDLLVAANAALCAETLTDSLSQVGNRRAFEQYLDSELQRVRRLSYPLSLLMIDIDHFKQFNEDYGHQTGDEIIRSVAQVIGRTIRTTDFVARIGGDEFVVLLPNTDARGARIMAERCRGAIEAEASPQHPVHISVGIAQLSPQTLDGPALIAAADQALRRAKQLGRNQVADRAVARGHSSVVRQAG